MFKPLSHIVKLTTLEIRNGSQLSIAKPLENSIEFPETWIKFNQIHRSDNYQNRMTRWPIWSIEIW